MYTDYDLDFIAEHTLWHVWLQNMYSNSGWMASFIEGKEDNISDQLWCGGGKQNGQ